MEGNKDDADKCFQIGLKHFNNSNNAEALKYFNKANRLFPSERTQGFIDRLTKQNSAEETDSQINKKNSKASMPGAHGTEGGAKYRKNHAGQTTPDPIYTTEQIEAVKKIRGCKDYYEILELKKDCSDDELKKAYRKLALKFHPDKNQAPGATEAFKAISNAFSVLSDPVKRRRYDEYGIETEHQSVSNRQHDYTHGFEADISAEDLFNAFFGGGTARGQRTTFRRAHFQHSNQNQDTQQPRNVWLQYAPLLFFILITVISSLFAGQPSYSLQSSSKYNVQRKTVNLNVPYYVKSDFLDTHRSDLRRIEAQIEEEYVDGLKNNCYREKVYRENMMWQARYQGNSDLYEHVKKIKTPSCDKLQDLYH